MSNRQKPTMPVSVKVALSLLAGSLAIGVLRVIVSPLPGNPALPPWFGPVVLMTTMVVLGLLIIAMAFGRRWAFITFAIMFVLGLPSSLPLAIRQLETSTGNFLVLIAQTIAQGIAVGILVMQPAREWFAECRKARVS